MKEEHKHSILQLTYFTTMLIGVMIVSFFILQSFLIVLFLAGTVAVVLSPMYERIVTFLRGRRGLASFLTIILAVIIIILPVTFLIRQVSIEAFSTYSQLNSGADSSGIDIVQKKIHELLPSWNIDLKQYLTSFSEWFLSHVGYLFSGTLDFILKTFLVIMALYYFLKDGAEFKNALIRFSPLPDEYDNKIISTLHNSIRSIVKGSLTISVIQGTLSGLGFWIFGLPNPALWGIIAAICALVPGIGTSLVLVPAVIYLLVTSTASATIGLAIWAIVIVGMVDNILSPILIERGIKIHPIFILFSIIGGLSFFGPAGFLLGPMFLSLLFTLFDIYHLFIQSETDQKKS